MFAFRRPLISCCLRLLNDSIINDFFGGNKLIAGKETVGFGGGLLPF